jgi:hypothetical protein
MLASVAAALLAGAATALFGVCGPFTDVAADAFCPFVLEVFTLGITTGTTPTTYDPTGSVSRLQMAAFLSRTVDGVLKRANRRAAMNRFWTTQSSGALGLTSLPGQPQGYCVSDGLDIWVSANGPISRVRASDGRLLETWTTGSEGNANGMVSAMGLIVMGNLGSPGKLYTIDPSQPAGAVTVVASNLGRVPSGLAFDGARVWTANQGTTTDGSVSVVTPSAIPWSATTVTTGFSRIGGILFDGGNIWVTDFAANTLLKLDGSAGILQTVTVGLSPGSPIFDGTNIWVPNITANSVTVVRASSGAVLQTLTGNGLNLPTSAAFDGERVLVTDLNGNGVSLWKAADLSTIGFFPTGLSSEPKFACSDGINFWINLFGTNKLARF